MTFTIPMVLDALAPFSPAAAGPEGAALRFDSVKLLPAPGCSCQPSALYVAERRDIERFLSAGPAEEFRPQCVVVTGGSAWSEAAECGLPLILIPNSYPLTQVFNSVQEMFTRTFQWAINLEQAACAGSLQEVIDVGGPAFSGLLIFWDAAFNIKAYSKGRPIQNPFLKNLIDRRYFTQDVVRNLLRHNLLGSPELHPRLRILEDNTLSGCAFYIRHFFHNGHRNCSAAMVATGEAPTQGEQDLLQYFFERLEAYVALHMDQSDNCNNLDEIFLRGLLDGTITEPEEIADRATALNIPYQQDYLVYVIDFKRFSRPQAEFLISHLRQKLPKEHIFINGEELYMLKSTDAFCCDSPQTRSSFSATLRTYNANCGLSQEFRTLAGCQAAYTQACAALRLGKRLSGPNCGSGNVFFYKDYTMYHMLEICDRQIDLFSLLPGRIISFYKANRANGRNDLELLTTYIDSGMSMAATAQALFLHRNSVAYRIKRIEEKLHLDLSDMDSVLNIQLLLKIIRYLNCK